MTLTVAITLLLFLTAVKAGWAAPPHRHSKDSLTPAARRWKPDRVWLRGAFCVHRHESVDWHRAGIDWRGNPSPYYGGMQFLVSTWRNAGGRGLPSDWAPREQFYRAWRVWKADGGSWREWGTAGACGLR